MARRTFSSRDVAEICDRWYAGHSLSRVATSLGMDRKTIRKYVAPALQAGLRPGGAPMSLSAWNALIRDWFPAIADVRLRQPSQAEISAYHAEIAQLLQEGLPQVTIYHQLREESGLTASLASLKRYVATNVRPHCQPQSKTTGEKRIVVSWDVLGVPTDLFHGPGQVEGQPTARDNARGQGVEHRVVAGPVAADNGLGDR